MRYIPILLFLSFTLSLTGQERSQSGLELQAVRAMVSQPERARHAMVASGHELASEAGIEILKRGGNAVDAAVAVAFVLAVVYPEAGNIGGGGYMVIRMADGRAKAIDYRETVPASTNPGIFQTRIEQHVGYKASGVPGTVAGLALAHQLFGALRWHELLAPARRLAEKGYPVSLRTELILPLQVPVMKPFPEAARIFLHGGDQPLKQGELLRQPDLAATIGRMQKQGWREFYEGETARRIAADMAAHGGTLTYEDLKGYQARLLDPIRGTYRKHVILTLPPSSGGGTSLLEMLNILECFPMRLGMEGSAESRHLMIEAMKRAYRDRGIYLADPAFFSVPVDKLIDKTYAANLARTIGLDRATTSKELADGPQAVAPVPGSNPQPANDRPLGESTHTTHFSIVDAAGNMVSNTYTLNEFYGSQVIAEGTGVLLNNIIGNFPFPDRPERERQRLVPGKRSVAGVTSTIVLRPDGTPWLALGSPGGTSIASTVIQVIINMIDYQMSLRDAIEFPRIHYESDRVSAEPGALVFEVAEKLKVFGHTLNPKLRSQGDVDAVIIEEGGWRAGWSDGRRGGRALGY
jgi:gamma-glutamyltranspeptidase/glutathione hydrolase